MKGILFFFLSMILPFLFFPIRKPVAPAQAIAGTKINSPGKTISDLTSTIELVEPVSSTIKVEMKKVVTHRKAVTAAILWILETVCIFIIITHIDNMMSTII